MSSVNAKDTINLAEFVDNNSRRLGFNSRPWRQIVLARRTYHMSLSSISPGEQLRTVWVPTEQSYLAVVRQRVAFCLFQAASGLGTRCAFCFFIDTEEAIVFSARALVNRSSHPKLWEVAVQARNLFVDSSDDIGI